MLQLSWEIGKLKDLFNIDKNIYTISPDTKIISKILEIQLFPKFKTFAKKNVMKSLLLKNKIGILIYLLCTKKIQTSSLLDAQIRD
ncbi:hypothetical protein HpDR115_13030 [Helicobacter pylori]